MGEPRQLQHLSPDKSKIHLLLAQLQHAQQLKNQLSSQHQEALELSSSSRRMSGCSPGQDQPHPTSPSTLLPLPPTTTSTLVVQPSATSRLPVGQPLAICPRSPGRQGQPPQQSYSSLRLLLSNLSLHALRSLEHQLLLVGSSSSPTNSSSQPSSSQTTSFPGLPSSSNSQTLLTPTPVASLICSMPPSAGRTSLTPLSPPRSQQSSSQTLPKRQVVIL